MKMKGLFISGLAAKAQQDHPQTYPTTAIQQSLPLGTSQRTFQARFPGTSQRTVQARFPGTSQRTVQARFPGTSQRTVQARFPGAQFGPRRQHLRTRPGGARTYTFPDTFLFDRPGFYPESLISNRPSTLFTYPTSFPYPPLMPLPSACRRRLNGTCHSYLHVMYGGCRGQRYIFEHCPTYQMCCFAEQAANSDPPVDTTNPVDPTPVDPPPNGSTTPAECTYNGATYPSGETFPDMDGCNTCQCTILGVMCTSEVC